MINFNKIVKENMFPIIECNNKEDWNNLIIQYSVHPLNKHRTKSQMMGWWEAYNNYRGKENVGLDIIKGEYSGISFFRNDVRWTIIQYSDLIPPKEPTSLFDLTPYR